jgi:hypothetical protein
MKLEFAQECRKRFGFLANVCGFGFLMVMVQGSSERHVEYKYRKKKEEEEKKLENSVFDRENKKKDQKRTDAKLKENLSEGLSI